MADTMIERVAVVLLGGQGSYIADPQRPDDLPVFYPDTSAITEERMKVARNDARKILSAMREPTESMTRAADAADYQCSEDVSMSKLGIDPAIPYRAMIDAALAEEG